jgi:TatD DNase family protein
MLTEKEDLNAVISRAQNNGVGYIQTICTNLENFPNIIAISQLYDNVFASVGVHPNEVKEQITYETLVNLSNHPKVIGLGETGLDYHYQTAKKNAQINSFQQHILAAQKTKLPIIVHTREAEQDTINMLTNAMKNDAFSGVIHCFTASKYLAQKMLDIGMYISIAGIITFKNAELLKEVVRFVPLDRLLIETDSPYLAPTPMRGKQNEPAFVKYVALAIAELKGIDIDKVAGTTTENFFNLFSKAFYR